MDMFLNSFLKSIAFSLIPVFLYLIHRIMAMELYLLRGFIHPTQNLYGHGVRLTVHGLAAIDDIGIPPNGILGIGGGAAGKYAPGNILIPASQYPQRTGRYDRTIPGKISRQFKIPLDEQHAATGHAAAKLYSRTSRIVIDDVSNAAGGGRLRSSARSRRSPVITGTGRCRGRMCRVAHCICEIGRFFICVNKVLNIYHSSVVGNCRYTYALNIRIAA